MIKLLQNLNTPMQLMNEWEKKNIFKVFEVKQQVMQGRSSNKWYEEIKQMENITTKETKMKVFGRIVI